MAVPTCPPRDRFRFRTRCGGAAVTVNGVAIDREPLDDPAIVVMIDGRFNLFDLKMKTEHDRAGSPGSRQ